MKTCTERMGKGSKQGKASLLEAKTVNKMVQRSNGMIAPVVEDNDH